MNVAAVFPDRWLSIFFSWITILSELVIFVGLIVRRWWTWVIWIAILFHLGMFATLYGNTFGHFVQSLGITYLAFLTWPTQRRRVYLQSGSQSWMTGLLRRLDTEGLFQWTQGSGFNRFTVMSGDRKLEGIQAVCAILFYSPGFYWLVFILFSVFFHLFPWPLKFFSSLFLVFVCVGFFGWATLLDLRSWWERKKS